MKPAVREKYVEQVEQRYTILAPYLTEQTRSIWAAAEALAIGRGGTAIVAETTGLSRMTIQHATRGVLAGTVPPAGRQRHQGGGRKCLLETDPTLLADLDTLIDPYTRGDPESPLRWSCKSTRQLAAALHEQGHRLSHRTVYALLDALGYSLQANRKAAEGKQHPDRDAQFHFIARQVKRVQKRHQPVISVDTKKKENIGNFANGGREWEPQGPPRRVKTHDFPEAGKGKDCPYGIYDLSRNEGWVNVGLSADTAQFAVESIRRWWQQMGKTRYPEATDLLITADGGAAMAPVSGYGNANSRPSPPNSTFGFRCVTFPPAPASGIKLNIGCLPSSVKTGGGSPWIVSRPSSTSLPTRPPRRGYILRLRLTRPSIKKALK